MTLTLACILALSSEFSEQESGHQPFWLLCLFVLNLDKMQQEGLEFAKKVDS